MKLFLLFTILAQTASAIHWQKIDLTGFYAAYENRDQDLKGNAFYLSNVGQGHVLVQVLKNRQGLPVLSQYAQGNSIDDLFKYVSFRVPAMFDFRAEATACLGL
ncbi:MAG: hypothetical protein WCK49_10070 [Myxococcaceae bacterium]